MSRPARLAATPATTAQLRLFGTMQSGTPHTCVADAVRQMVAGRRIRADTEMQAWTCTFSVGIAVGLIAAEEAAGDVDCAEVGAAKQTGAPVQQP